MQDERLVTIGLHLPGQVGLVRRRVDVRVAVVLEDAEEPVEPHVDTGGLDHRVVERLEGHPLGVDLGQDVAVGEQHTRNLPATRGPAARPHRRPGARRDGASALPAELADCPAWLCGSTGTSPSATRSPRASATTTPCGPTAFADGRTGSPRRSPEPRATSCCTRTSPSGAASLTRSWPSR